MCSDGTTLVWGEPFGDRLPISRLAATLSEFREGDGHLKYAIGDFEGELSQDWIANLNPGLNDLRAAHLTFFERLFAIPAAKRGFERWGVKWVRLSANDAWYLKWLYPDCRIVFLIRHPLDAYRSYRGKRWFTVRPHYVVNGIVRFLTHWRYLAESFAKEHENLRAFVVRYEDLVQDQDVLCRLSDHLDIRMDETLLKRPVGARSKNQPKVNWREKFICSWMTRKICNALGYSASESGSLIRPIPSAALPAPVGAASSVAN